jgi:hypothetical protein
VKVILRLTVSRPVCPYVRPPSGPVFFPLSPWNFLYFFIFFVILWGDFWREDGSVIYCFSCISPAQSLSDLSPAGLKTIFYCPNFRDSPNLEVQVPVLISPRNRVAQLYPRALGSLSVAFYDSHGYGGGFLTLLHTKSKWKLFYDWRSASQNVFGVEPTVGKLLFESCGLVSVGLSLSLWWEEGSAVCSAITQWSESCRILDHALRSHLRLPQSGGPGSPYL